MNKDKFDNAAQLDSSLPKVATTGSNATSRFIRKAIPKRKKLNSRVDFIDDYENTELPLMIEEPLEPTAELPLMISASRKQMVNVSVEKMPEEVQQPIQNKKNSKGFKKILSFLGVAVCIFVAVYSATKIGLWTDENDESTKQLEEIRSLIVERVVEPVIDENQSSDDTLEAPKAPTQDKIDYSKLSLVDVDFSKLKAVNNETKAYMKINGLDVSVPVVQTMDNKYYLSHSFDKTNNSAGWIFGDYRNDWDNLKQNTIIYGHNRRNYIMFGSLKKVLDKSWYENKDNHVIYISTENSNMLFQIFSAYTIDTETYYLTNEFDSDDEYQIFLDTMVARSEGDFDVTPTVQDKILTLSTCHTSTTKMVIHAKLIHIQDKQ